MELTTSIRGHQGSFSAGGEDAAYVLDWAAGLPAPALQRVLCFLPSRQGAACALVCQAWRAALAAPELWCCWLASEVG